ncbi:MAG: hypothetical protein JST26_11945 [Bacteroidetes bacterium]|nr:hypothetical protein [Bacteroidota bacterium]
MVLKTDSITIFNDKYPSLISGESYFVCKEDYTYSFTDAGFDKFRSDLKSQSPDILAFKSADNKSLICIFPKLSTKGIYELHDFVLKQFEESAMSQVKTKQTIHVQVVDSYDPHDLPSEKGFSYN